MKRLSIVVFVGLFAFAGIAQTQKVALTHSVYSSWNDVASPSISNDGQWVFYEINPQDGDGCLWLSKADKSIQRSFDRGHKAAISANSNFLVYQIKPFKSATRKAKLDKKKKEDMPKDSVALFTIGSQKSLAWGKVKSYKLAEKGGDWVAILLEEEKKDGQTPKDSTKSEDRKATKKSSKSDKNEKAGTLFVVNPLTDQKFEFGKVTDYTVSKDGSQFLFASISDDSLKNCIINIFDTKKAESKVVFSQKGEAAGLSLDYSGNQTAFLFTADTGKVKIFDLYYYTVKEGILKEITTETHGMPEGWALSNNFTPYFSDKGNRLFVGTAPKPVDEPKDTLTDDEKAVFDLWSWTDTLLQTQQLVALKENAKRSFLSVFHVKEKRFVQLADKGIPRLRVGDNGDAPFAIGENSTPYDYSMTWDAPTRSDFYQIDIKTGKRTLIVTGNPFRVYLSPSGNFAAYYNDANNAWCSWSAKDKKVTCLTANLGVNLFDEDNDMPIIPNPYGFAGWVDGDKYMVIYDRYDLWALDPAGKLQPVCLTGGMGRRTKTVYRYQKTDPEVEYIKAASPILLQSFNKVNKQAGYSQIVIDKPNAISNLVSGDYKIRFVQKASNSDKIVWQRESYREYRDIWTSNLQFANPIKLSQANPQMDNYLWGSVELVSWFDFNRDTVQGLLYKPENFDPNRKYPMMVYFYETHTDNLHSHFEPKPGRSVICPTLYVSNDYVVFIPDIKYRTGTPGRSAYDAVISGTMAMINKGFIDKDRVGVQGQSWGGYQIAYLVTQTDLFKAASAGAPVSNMTSAYGGIRWGSGLSRMFQYEHTQSRIGGTLWEKPLNYIENSPLFYAPRVNTPLLIRHDDADEAVPWYQGIEYFVALRRLGKPVWMINYNDDSHNLVRRANRVDWTVRMMQFFDYYLKDTQMPKWMKEGIPAENKGKDLGLEY
ncbi:MAG: S9 family peptidase [Bacteroidales bacterium]|nr:S9 family peptidase [Bacteroidales bacterium]